MVDTWIQISIHCGGEVYYLLEAGTQHNSAHLE